MGHPMVRERRDKVLVMENGQQALWLSHHGKKFPLLQNTHHGNPESCRLPAVLWQVKGLSLPLCSRAVL